MVDTVEDDPSGVGGVGRIVGFWLGLALAIGLQFITPPEGLSADAWMVVSLAILMITWWISEALPIPVTALLPIVVLPMTGVSTIGQATAPYAAPVVMLLLGGFIIAKAVERWNLHARIALNVVASAGSHPAALVGGFMAAAALISMWISNTATTIMLMPIALSVAAAVLGKNHPRGSAFTLCLLLGTAYAASLGGLATPIGTPTNTIIIGYLEANTDSRISFGQWMMFGVPVMLAMVPAAWFILTKMLFPIHERVGAAGLAAVRAERDALGRITTPEARTMMAFAVIAGLWIFRQPLQAFVEIGGIKPFAGLTDHLIAIFGAILLFLIPAGGAAPKGARLLDWQTAESVPWGVYIMFGGGLSLAAGIEQTGLATWLGGELSWLGTMPIIVIVGVIVTLVIFATEFTSNIATASALMPVVGAIAVATGADPVLLAAPLAMAASCAFMLPMATGPNAVAFATGQVTIPQMARAGLALNIVGIVLITGIVTALSPLLGG